MTATPPTRHHPVQPEPVSTEQEDGAPNPTQLPVEPEFGTMLPPTDADDPGGAQPPR
jgi:hypothetical protein